MKKKTKENFITVFLVIATVAMTILRFLLNEKGRVNPDSIRYMRFANVLPEIDNTVTPTGYPIAIKFFTIFGTDEFWSSKIVGIVAYLFMVVFAWRKKFYFKEVLAIGALFSFVSIFSYTMSEALILPFVFIFLYFCKNVILQIFPKWKSVLYLTVALIFMYNIRYSALFFIAGCLVFGGINLRKKYGKAFLLSGFFAAIFVVLYKYFFIDYFNGNYVKQWLDVGLHPTSKLLMELLQGLSTTFNPFIHIANPGGGIINVGIYGLGLLTIFFIIYIFKKTELSTVEGCFVFLGVFGILCSYFIQYFYSVNPLDYRLLAPFSFPIWLVFLKKLFGIFGKYTFLIPALSLCTGFIFTLMSRGDYLENRRQITSFLKKEKIEKKWIIFFVDEKSDPNDIQIAELISTVNPKVRITNNSKDTLSSKTLTENRVLQKIQLSKNKYQ